MDKLIKAAIKELKSEVRKNPCSERIPILCKAISIVNEIMSENKNKGCSDDD